MSVEYRVTDRTDPEFPGMVCIETWQDGELVACSWDEPSVDPAIRLNVDYPSAVDERAATETTEIAYRVLDVAEAKAAGISDDLHRVIATYAAVVEAVPLADAATAVGLPAEALVAEAQAWAVAAAEQ